MNPKVRAAALRLVGRAAAQGRRGTTADAHALAAFARDTGGRIQPWYAELLTGIPLCGLELGWPAYPPTAGESGTAWMRWSDVSDLRAESLNRHPGLDILDRGYVNVALDLEGDGAPYFIPVDGGDDPPVYRVYDEAGWGPERIVAEGMVLVARSLSELFSTALLRGDGAGA
jgi:hypothetical protein